MDDVEAIDSDDLLDELIDSIDAEVEKIIYIPPAPPAPPAPPVPTIEPTISKASKLKKKWSCYKCGLNLASKEKLNRHMTSRNCKRLRPDDDESPEPHEAIGSNLKECLENYKKLKDKNFNNDKIL